MTQTSDRAGPPLPLDAAVAAMEPLRRAMPAVPVLHQYWDADPPRQVRKLLRHNARQCRRFGLEHRVWDRARALAFMAGDYPQHLDLFRDAPHAAMGSDLLRLCILERHGGLYLDADMALRARGGARLAGLLHEGLVFKWSLPDRHNLPNWCLGFRAGHPMLADLIAGTAAAMRGALAADPDAALRDILHVSGPGRFTRIVASWIATHGCPPGFLVLDVQDAYAMVQNGPSLLNAPLDYKKTGLHWLVASRKTRG